MNGATVLQFPLDATSDVVTTPEQIAAEYPELVYTVTDDDIDDVLERIDRIAVTRYSVAEILARAPQGAAALIVAELDEDMSESMTDYYAHRTVRCVAIGWRKSKREDFRALRRAAASFEPTAHMAPGCDEWTPRVVLLDNVRGENYYAGQWSHWHSDLDDHGHYTFLTEAEARAFVAAQGDPHPITFGEQLVRFGWQITRASIEHRENYSMGGGNYLKAGFRHGNGWKVHSYPVGYLGSASYEIGGEIARNWR